MLSSECVQSYAKCVQLRTYHPYYSAAPAASSLAGCSDTPTKASFCGRSSAKRGCPPALSNESSSNSSPRASSRERFRDARSTSRRIARRRSFRSCSRCSSRRPESPTCCVRRCRRYRIASPRHWCSDRRRGTSCATTVTSTCWSSATSPSAMSWMSCRRRSRCLDVRSILRSIHQGSSRGRSRPGIIS